MPFEKDCFAALAHRPQNNLEAPVVEEAVVVVVAKRLSPRCCSCHVAVAAVLSSGPKRGWVDVDVDVQGVPCMNHSDGPDCSAEDAASESDVLRTCSLTLFDLSVA